MVVRDRAEASRLNTTPLVAPRFLILVRARVIGNGFDSIFLDYIHRGKISTSSPNALSGAPA
jgi:hypothetical protein